MSASGVGLSIDLTVERRHFPVTAALEVAPGERVALFGPSGAGKTTVLEATAGLLEPTRGSVRLGDETLSLPPRPAGRLAATLRRVARGDSPAPLAAGRVALARQPATLFPHLDVEANVAYGNADRAAAARVLEAVGLAPFRRARPHGLSGGQRQRVSLARALARQFSVLLLDEPMSAIDDASRDELWSVVEGRCREEGAIALLVTHDLAEAQRFGDRIALIDEGDLVAVGDPHDLVASPPTRRVAEIVGYRSFVELHLPGGGGDRLVELAIDEDRLLLGSYPERGAVLSGVVTACVPRAARYEVTLLVPAGSPVVLAGGRAATTGSPSTLRILLAESLSAGTPAVATATTPPVVRGAAPEEVWQEMHQ